LKTAERTIEELKGKVVELECEKEAISINNKTLGINTPNPSFYSPNIESTRKFTPMNDLSVKVIDRKIENALNYDDDDDDYDGFDESLEYGVPGDKVDIDLIKRLTEKCRSSINYDSDIDIAADKIIAVVRNMDRKDPVMRKAFMKLCNVYMDTIEQRILSEIDCKRERKSLREHYENLVLESVQYYRTVDSSANN
jgi:hypothetical protein